MPIKAPPCYSGSSLQCINPVAGGIDGAPLNATGVAAVSTNTIGAEAFYIISTTPVHFRTSFAGTLATANEPFIPAYTPLVFACNRTDKISIIKVAGSSDGTTYIHACEETT